MPRAAEQFRRVARLDDASTVHHERAPAGFRNDAEVVRHQDYRHTELRLQGADLLQNLGLGRDIECRGGLVGNQELRIARQGHRDHHPLAHAARQLVRVIVQAAYRSRNVHLGQQFCGHATRLATGQVAVAAQYVHHLVADREDRIQGRHRLLKNHRDIAPTDVFDLAVRQRHKITTLQFDTACRDPARRHRDKAQDRQPRDCLATTRLAHQSQGLVGVHVETDTVHGPHHAVLGAKLDGQVTNPQHRDIRLPCHQPTLRGSSASCRASATALKAITRTNISSEAARKLL